MGIQGSCQVAGSVALSSERSRNQRKGEVPLLLVVVVVGATAVARARQRMVLLNCDLLRGAV